MLSLGGLSLGGLSLGGLSLAERSSRLSPAGSTSSWVDRCSSEMPSRIRKHFSNSRSSSGAWLSSMAQSTGAPSATASIARAIRLSGGKSPREPLHCAHDRHPGRGRRWLVENHRQLFVTVLELEPPDDRLAVLGLEPLNRGIVPVDVLGPDRLLERGCVVRLE